MIQLQRLSLLLDRCIVFSLVHVRSAHFGVGVQGQRIEFQRPFHLSRRIVEAPHGDKVIGIPVVCCPVAGVQLSARSNSVRAPDQSQIETDFVPRQRRVRFRQCWIQLQRFRGGGFAQRVHVDGSYVSPCACSSNTVPSNTLSIHAFPDQVGRHPINNEGSDRGQTRSPFSRLLGVNRLSAIRKYGKASADSAAAAPNALAKP